MVFKGTCDDMCPKSEMLAAYRQFSIFERDDQNRPDENAIVKEYRRAGADQKEPLADELRTPKALETTMNYLIFNIVNDKRSESEELAMEWYDFLWDRMRAIRKDITQQSICDQDATQLVERCARFHIASCYMMNRVKDFDTDMNKRNLNDCLQMLRQMYKDLRETGVVCPGESEFQKYDLLLHLDEDSLTANVLLKTSEYRYSEDMQFVIKIYNAYSSNNFYKFFKLLEEADYMTSCILCLFVNRVRIVAIKIIFAAINPRQGQLCPAELVIDLLGFDDLEDFKEFSTTLGIEIQEKNSAHFLVLKKDLLPTIRQREALVPGPKSKKLVEYKIPQSVTIGHMVYGNGEPVFNLHEKDHIGTSEDIELTDSSYCEEQASELSLSGLSQASKDHFKTYTETFEDKTAVTSTPIRYSSPARRHSVNQAEAEVQDVQLNSISSWFIESKNEVPEPSCRTEIEVFEQPKVVTKCAADLEARIQISPVKEIVPILEACRSPTPGQSLPEENHQVEINDEVEEGDEEEEENLPIKAKRSPVKVAFDMPAGRFKTTYSKPLMIVPPVKATFVSPRPAKRLKTTNYKEQIDEERRFNEKMYKLIQIINL